MTQQPCYHPQYQYPPFPGSPAQPIPLADGALDAFYNQPTGGSGPSISWRDKPEGTAYAGVVARDVVNGDVLQQTDPISRQPQFHQDGRPKLVMKIPLKVQPGPEFPDGEATLYVRGQLREELVRAMSEVGSGGAPKGGDAIQVTLIQRKPRRGGGNPMNVFAVRYRSRQGAAPAAPPRAQRPTAQPPADLSPEQQALLARLTRNRPPAA